MTPEEIHTEVLRSLVTRVLAPLKLCRTAKAKPLLYEVSTIADYYVVNRSGAKLARDSKDEVRRGRRVWEQSLRQVRCSITSLCAAENIARDLVATTLKRGALSFRTAHRELSIVERTLERLRIDSAAAIHPKFRPESRPEQKLAEQFPGKLYHVQGPVTEHSVKLRDEVARTLHTQITKFTGGDKRAQVREFIREFFAAFDEPFEYNVVKEILKKPRKRAQSRAMESLTRLR
jgi:hypothetical protein